jgi:hypothetical protein
VGWVRLALAAIEPGTFEAKLAEQRPDCMGLI